MAAGSISNDDLSAGVGDATAGLLACVDGFGADDGRWIGPYRPEVNPPLWELAHVAWFAEWFVLRQLHGRRSLIEGADARYDSGRIPHRTRWQLDLLDPAATVDYLNRVADDLIDVVGDDRGLDSTAHFVAYAVAHHDAHTEALTYTAQTLGWGNRPPWSAPALDGDGAGDEPAVDGDRAVAGGRLILGASRSQPFVMDNEKWGHPVDVEPFRLAVNPVTVAQFAEFVAGDGYGTEQLWSPDGWAWRQAVGASEPAYWRRAGDGWERRLGIDWRPVEADGNHPMVHVSWWEADAFCRWAGRRLPTEAEWEMAATTGPDGNRQPRFPWGDRPPTEHEAALDARTEGTVPVSARAGGDGPWGHRQLIGNVWEWTSTVFEPYPNFEPDAYRDNSEPWFGDRRVLRGGSWATRSRYVRSTFRNYFTPDRRDVIAGFRTCAR